MALNSSTVWSLPFGGAGAQPKQLRNSWGGILTVWLLRSQQNRSAAVILAEKSGEDASLEPKRRVTQQTVGIDCLTHFAIGTAFLSSY